MKTWNERAKNESDGLFSDDFTAVGWFLVTGVTY
jgi:hypothetical protein